MLHRLFAASRLHVIIVITGILQLCWGLTFSLVFAFQCRPIQRPWKLSGPAKCINTRALGIASGVINIIVDVVILILPQYIVWNLQIRRGEKLALTGIFIVGAL